MSEEDQINTLEDMTTFTYWIDMSRNIGHYYSTALYGSRSASSVGGGLLDIISSSTSTSDKIVPTESYNFFTACKIIK